MVQEDKHTHQTVNNIKIAFFLNLSFTIIEIIGGVLTNSVAILSDALHDLGDSLSLGIAWYLENYSQRQADYTYTYGYRRFSLLGAIITSIVLIFGSLIVLSEAFPRLFNPEEANAPGMIALAILGILINGTAVLRLQKGKGISARAVSWHMLEDVLGWTAVLVVGIVMTLVELPILDPVLSICLAFYVLYNVIKNVRKSLNIFLQAIPDVVDLPELQKQLLTVKNVRSQHHTHLWSLDGQHHVFTTHLVIDNKTESSQHYHIRRDVEKLVEPYELAHLTIQIEYEDEACEFR